jgi:glycosyltransferase involved in cell wall biosynthesis
MISLSIIIPLFDKASFVAQTIAQLVQQLQADDEIIVVDDCSRDEGPAIVQALRHPAVRLLRSQRNDGPASARNLGASQACGTHLLFFDADDLAQPCLLAGLRAAIAGHPSEGVWAYDLAFEAHGESARAEATKTQLPGGDTVVMERDAFVNSCLKGKPLCTASSTCVRADLFKAAGGFVT